MAVEEIRQSSWIKPDYSEIYFHCRKQILWNPQPRESDFTTQSLMFFQQALDLIADNMRLWKEKMITSNRKKHDYELQGDWKPEEYDEYWRIQRYNNKANDGYENFWIESFLNALDMSSHKVKIILNYTISYGFFYTNNIIVV